MINDSRKKELNYRRHDDDTNRNKEICNIRYLYARPNYVQNHRNIRFVHTQ